MKLIQCPNHHYYDSDKHAACPYCAQAAAGAGSVTVPLGQQAFRPETPAVSAPPDPVPQAAESYAAPQAEAAAPEAFRAQAPEMPAAGSDAFRMPAPETPAAAPFYDDSRTVSYYARSIGTEPVVGWLVAVEGKYFGEDFRLKSGRNFIGRSPEMDVQLSLDLSVSRRRHAIIVYEPRQRIFIAQPGDSRELFYRNDEVVLGSTVLKDRDILTIGETKLMLVTLCGGTFGWEDYRKEPER